MEKQFEIKTKPCVGCGFCCINSRCIASQRLYKSADICPALIWSDVDNRYYCNLMMIEGSVVHIDKNYMQAQGVVQV